MLDCLPAATGTHFWYVQGGGNVKMVTMPTAEEDAFLDAHDHPEKWGIFSFFDDRRVRGNTGTRRCSAFCCQCFVSFFAC